MKNENVNDLKDKIQELEQKVAEAEAIRESLAISEAKHKTIIDNLKDIIFTHDINGTVVYVTSSVRQYGYEEQAVIGHNMLEFVHPDDWPQAMEAHQKLMGGADEMAFNIKLLSRDGQVRVMEDHAKTVRNREGMITHIVGVLRDITEKKAAEEALEKMNKELEKYVWQRTLELSKAYEALKTEGQQRRRAENAKVDSEHLLSELISFLPDPTFMIDRKSHVTAWNHAMEELTGIKAVQMLGKGDYEYALPFYNEKRPILIDYALNPVMRQDKKYQAITQKGDTIIAEAFTPRLKDQPTYLWGIAKPHYDSQGNIMGAIESIRDITHIKNMSFKLQNELGKFRALYDLAVNMSAEKSMKHNLIFIVEKSRELLSTDAAYIALVDEKEECLAMHTLSGIATEAFKALRVPLDRGVGGMILQTRKGRIIGDYFTHDEITRIEEHIIRDEGLISSMAVPIFAADKGLGVLYVANRKATTFSQDDLNTLLLFGNLAAVEIVRQRAESDLKESEAKYRTVFETTGSAMIIIEKNGILSLVNEEFARMTGFTKEEIEGKKRWKEFVVPEDIPLLAQESKKQMMGQRQSLRQYEYRFQDRYGNPRNVFLTADIIPGMQKSVAALADITHHKVVEEDLKRAHAELEMRVLQRTRELTVANEGLKELLQKQDVNIDLAKNILAMINLRPHRHTLIRNGADLFFTAFYLPCNAEGGDHYFIKNFSEGNLGVHKTAVSLKDQSGHEVSCILRSIITDLIHNALLVNTPQDTLEETVTQLNKAICGLPFFGESNFFTAINTEIDHENLKMRYVSAGHPPFLFIRGKEVACLPPLDGSGRNLPVGILETINFTAGELQLQKGDKLIFFTDGVTDMPRRTGNPVLNTETLTEILSTILEEYQDIPVSLLMARLFNRINGAENDKIVNVQGFGDDISLLGLELENDRQEFEDVIQPQNLDDFSYCIAGIFQKIKGEWQERGFAEPDTRLHIVLEEALANAWTHGNAEDPEKKIVVRRRYGNDAVLEVIDEGRGFDFEKHYNPTSGANILSEHGRGNFIMRLFTEEIIRKEGGRHLIAFFARLSQGVHSLKTDIGFDLWKRMKRK